MSKTYRFVKPLSVLSIKWSWLEERHSLLSPSLLSLNHSEHQVLFQWVDSSHQVVKVSGLQLQHQSFSMCYVRKTKIASSLDCWERRKKCIGICVLVLQFWPWSTELSCECMFLGSLSHHNKDLEQRTLKPSVHHSSRVLDKPCYSS